MFWPYKFCTDDKKLLSFAIRVFNKSWWSVNSRAILCELPAYFSLEITPVWVFMCCRWLKKPKFNDVCVLSKHSNFAPECLKCSLRGPGFKIFPSLPTPKLLPPTENLNEKPCATACIFVCRRTQNFTTIDQEKHLEPYDTQINQTKFVFGAEFQTLSPTILS